MSKPPYLSLRSLSIVYLIHLFHYHDHFCFAVERTHAHIHPAPEQSIHLSLSFASFLLIHEPLRTHTRTRTRPSTNDETMTFWRTYSLFWSIDRLLRSTSTPIVPF